MGLKELEAQLLSLSPAEKAEALKLLTLDLTHTWPGIERTQGIAGGDACLVRTRIPVWSLENYRRLGWSEARILENYPTLRAAGLVNAGPMPTPTPAKCKRRLRAMRRPRRTAVN